jgi:glycosyltransferase involved in cell wall biosynthesis
MRGKYSIPDASYEIHQSPHWKWADVVNIHWISEWLSAESLMTHAGDKPLIWTLHDEHLFTGGCHYSEHCTGFERDCSNCPLLAESSLPDIASHYLKAKLHAYQQFQPDMKIIAPSQWMVNKAGRSSLLSGIEGKRIFNSLDRQIFLPVPQEVCREVLGIEKDKTVLLTVTQTMEDERKGYRILKEALNSDGLPDNWILCTVGKLDPSQEVSGIPHKHLGSIQDQRFMAIIYNSASIFIHPATEDNLPNVVAEALMCGIPVAGFNIGGMPEMIDESNGRLADEISASALLEVVNKSLELTGKREKISADAALRYSADNQARDFFALAESMLKASRSAQAGEA